jgi:hypothetical protein
MADARYIIIENINPGMTFYNYIGGDSTEDEILRGLYQIMASLHFAYNSVGFTHYDLHTANVMQHDFLNAPAPNVFPQNPPPIQNPLIVGMAPDNVLFKYFINGDVYLIPANYIYVIIDFGMSYVGTRGAINQSAIPTRAVHLMDQVRTPEKPNEDFDHYSVLMHSMITILSSDTRRHFLIDVMANPPIWKVTPLGRLYRHFLESYEFKFPRLNSMMNGLALVSAAGGRNVRNTIIRMIDAHTAPERLVGVWKWRAMDDFPWYPPPSPASNAISPLRSSGAVLNWMRDNFFQNVFPANYTHVFNWGDLPPNTLQGIEPSQDRLNAINMANQIYEQRAMVLKEAESK